MTPSRRRSATSTAASARSACTCSLGTRTPRSPCSSAPGRVAPLGGPARRRARSPPPGSAGGGCERLGRDGAGEGWMEGGVDAVSQAQGAVGVLINNAGYSQSGAVETVPMDQARRQFETNVFGLLRLTQLVLPGMRAQRWGKVVNISSMGGRLTFPGGGLYHATKYSVEAISDAMRFEVRGFGVDVIVIEPGLIITNFGEVASASVTDAANGGDYADFNRKVAELTEGTYKGPMAKLGARPEAGAKTIQRATSTSEPRARIHAHAR